MKKIFFYGLMLGMSVFGLTSCNNDDYEKTDSRLTYYVNLAEDSDEFYRLIEGIAPSVRAYTVRNLAAGGSFFYQVKARYINGTESNWSEVEQVTLADGEHTYSIGDINHDSIVNITDVTALINMLLTEGDICTICADCYPDGKINISDVTALIHYLLSHQW